jgi:hypothetical protein
LQFHADGLQNAGFCEHGSEAASTRLVFCQQPLSGLSGAPSTLLHHAIKQFVFTRHLTREGDSGFLPYPISSRNNENIPG